MMNFIIHSMHCTSWSSDPNEGGHWEPSVTLRTLACIFVLVLDGGRSRRYRRSCGNGWVVLARNVSRGGSGTEGSPGESSLHRAWSSQVVLGRNGGGGDGSTEESVKDSRARRPRTYNHGAAGGSQPSDRVSNLISSPK
jgi:hypothetical protein